jgi:hypothetical protein
MPTVSTSSAGSVAAFGAIRQYSKNYDILTDVEVIHNYSTNTPTITNGRLYVGQDIYGYGGPGDNFWSYSGEIYIFYYNTALTQPVTNLIFKIKGDRYFHAAANGYITELIPSLGWDNYRYTANWAGVDIDNPAWLGVVSNNSSWAGVKFLNSAWLGVITNTANWIGELVVNNSWEAPLVNNPNWTAPIVDNPDWLGELVNNPDLNWVAPLVENPDWTQTYYDNPDPNWVAPLVNNPDTNWQEPIIPTPSWPGEPIYDENNDVIGYDASNPLLSNGGLMYEGRTEANEGLVREARTPGNLGLLPEARTEGNYGLIREARTEDNQGLIRDPNGYRDLANGGKMYAERSEFNEGLIPETASEDNGGLIRDTSNPQLSNGGQYYDTLAPRTAANGGFEIKYDDAYRTKENGGLLYDLTATRTLANNGIINSKTGEYRTVANGGLVYKQRTIENGAFVPIWVPWVVFYRQLNGSLSYSTIYTRNIELIGSKAYFDDNRNYSSPTSESYHTIFLNIRLISSSIIYQQFGILKSPPNDFNVEQDTFPYSILVSQNPNKLTLKDRVYDMYGPYSNLSSTRGSYVFFSGTELDQDNPNFENASDGSYEIYAADNSGTLRDSSRFDGEYWYSFNTDYANVLKNGDSYTVELYVKPDTANAAEFNFGYPYASAEIAREAAMGIISMSDGIDAGNKWVLSIAPNKQDGLNYFQFERKSNGEGDVFIIPIPYTEGNLWQHVAITYNAQNNNLCFYLNGLLVCKTLQPAPAQMTTSATLDVGVRDSIGATKTGIFNGRIKELRIANKNVYLNGETTGEIDAPTGNNWAVEGELQPWGYGFEGYPHYQDIQPGNCVLLTLRMLYYSQLYSRVPEAVVNFNRPSIKNIRIVGLYAQKVLIEYELASHGLISKTYIGILKNRQYPGYTSYENLDYTVLPCTTVYPGAREEVTVIEEIALEANLTYNFQIMAVSSAGTAISNIYYFKTPNA